MPNRLTQIATRIGDDGSTGLGDGTRGPNDHLRIAVLGDIEELGSSLGVRIVFSNALFLPHGAPNTALDACVSVFGL